MPLTLAVGAVFRRETRYLREWIEFHLMLGVERFYLYCHATPEDDPRDRRDAEEVIEPYIDGGYVTYVPFDEQVDFQMKANDAMLAAAKADGVKWLAILDLDEFLFPVDPRLTLPDWLAQHDRPTAAGFAVWWRCYGSSGLRYPPMLQTEAFTMRAADQEHCNYTHKFIFKPALIESHDNRWRHGDILDEHGENVVKNKRFGTCDSIRMNHYVIRSLADWDMRVRRRFPDKGFRLAAKDLPNYYGDRWNMYEKNDVEDTILHRYLPQLKRRLGIEY